MTLTTEAKRSAGIIGIGIIVIISGGVLGITNSLNRVEDWWTVPLLLIGVGFFIALIGRWTDELVITWPWSNADETKPTNFQRNPIVEEENFGLEVDREDIALL